jgi:hypothetical protein
LRAHGSGNNCGHERRVPRCDACRAYQRGIKRARRLRELYQERERLLREFDAAYDQKVGPHTEEEKAG